MRTALWAAVVCLSVLGGDASAGDGRRPTASRPSDSDRPPARQADASQPLSDLLSDLGKLDKLAEFVEQTPSLRTNPELLDEFWLAEIEEHLPADVPPAERATPRPPRHHAGSRLPGPGTPGLGTLSAELLKYDRDRDGQIGLYEWPPRDYASFERLDTNRDGFLTAREQARSSEPRLKER